MRIKSLIDLIDNAKICVDVGSDHAKLSIGLIEKNKSQYVYNIEKNLGPFQNSIQNTKKYSNRIFNIKSDGFNNFDPRIKIDYCVISGMGANNILTIIDNSKNSIINFLFCPNNNAELIREWIYKNKLKVLVDKTICDSGYYYEIILASIYKGYRLFKKDIFFGKRKLKKNDIEYINKLKSDISNINIDNIKLNNKWKYKQYLKILKYIKKYDNK